MRLTISNLGPIRQANIEFGDLTLFVGPQASGKSLALQLYKLATEYPAIKKTLVDHGYDPTRGAKDFLTYYLGEGMGATWGASSALAIGKKTWTYESIRKTIYKNSDHSVFYIPAQRVMTFENGWPRRFSSYDISVPYVTREFSESLFLFLDRAYSETSGLLFPQPKNLKAALKESLSESIYRGGSIRLDKQGTRKKLVLQPAKGLDLPMATWSTGQREFTPLLLGLYKLIPGSAKEKDEKIKTVIIEEPEMGLHPKAISSFMLIVMELLYRGYSVVISTHSPTILEIVWALKALYRKEGFEKELLRIFGESQGQAMKAMATECLKKKIRTFYFKIGEAGTDTVDISDMDPDAEIDEASWGGLTSQSGRIGHIIASTGYAG
jgi:energy-coupling factor transporter ATP-binding protein EcfA2